MMLPDFEKLNKVLLEMPPDPSLPLRPRPSKETLLQYKDRIVKYWRPRNLRMIDDEKMYKMITDVDDRLGQEDIAGSETLVFNDPYVLVEKITNMLSSQEPSVDMTSVDPGQRDLTQKTQDYCYWWREEANTRWVSNLNNTIDRDEVHYLCLRGWIAGRLMLDPGDPDFPFRYDVIDPIHVYPQKGPKGLRWVYHIYKDSKVNVLSDLGWNNDVLNRIMEQLGDKEDNADVEIAAYYDDVWHVLFIDGEEIWSACHNYGFVPWIIGIGVGPPIRRTDPQFGSALGSGRGYNERQEYTAWIGVSVFQSIKDIQRSINKLGSAILTEAMKAPNPPIVIKTNPQGEAEGKTIDTAIGSTSYLLNGQEDFQVVQFGFRPSELAPLMQMLTDARNRGTLPSVMYGEGANYLSGFATSLLQSGSRDLLFPLIKAKEHFEQNKLRMMLRLTAELYPFPVNMLATDPDTGMRTALTSISPDEIKQVGYQVRVAYKNIFPQDRHQAAMIASLLIKDNVISRDTARGEEFVNLKNPALEAKKVFEDIALTDPNVIRAIMPSYLQVVNPMYATAYERAQLEQKQQELMQMMLMASQGQQNKQTNVPGAPPPGPPPIPHRARQVGAQTT
jgi:hypothetical protein